MQRETKQDSDWPNLGSVHIPVHGDGGTGHHDRQPNPGYTEVIDGRVLYAETRNTIVTTVNCSNVPLQFLPN